MGAYQEAFKKPTLLKCTVGLSVIQSRNVQDVVRPTWEGNFYKFGLMTHQTAEEVEGASTSGWLR